MTLTIIILGVLSLAGGAAVLWSCSTANRRWDKISGEYENFIIELGRELQKSITSSESPIFLDRLETPQHLVAPRSVEPPTPPPTLIETPPPPENTLGI